MTERDRKFNLDSSVALFNRHVLHFSTGDYNDGNGSLALPRTVIIDRDRKVIRIIGAEGADYVNKTVK